MSDEKDNKSTSKGSNLIQLKVSDKMHDNLKKIADELGMPVNTYIYHLLIKDVMENKEKGMLD